MRRLHRHVRFGPNCDIDSARHANKSRPKAVLQFNPDNGQEASNAKALLREGTLSSHEAPTALQSPNESLKRFVTLPRRFLLHPVPDARYDSGAAEICAGDPRVGIKVQSRDECAHGVTLSSDEG